MRVVRLYTHPCINAAAQKLTMSVSYPAESSALKGKPRFQGCGNFRQMLAF